MTRRNTKYLNFVFALLFFASCGNDVSTNNSALLSGTWIVTKITESSDKTGYVPNDNRYAKYKYLDLNQNNKGVLWGGKIEFDGFAAWDEKNKIIELQARDSLMQLMDFEKFTIDSLSTYYMQIVNVSFLQDTTLTKKIFFKK